MSNCKDLRGMAAQIRQDVIKMTYLAGPQGAHIGGSLSLVEILTALYGCVMRIDPERPMGVDRDRLILSKGHGAIALYAALSYKGLIPREDLWSYKHNDTYITGHPGVHPDHGIEFASGSLGQGLSIGAGVCYALRRKGNQRSRVFVIMGDGECGEVSVWEAAAFAAQHHLNNLIGVIDCNRLQYDGETSRILDMEDWVQKWSAFGWDALRVDGHDIEKLCAALSARTERPRILICDTIKGKGVSFIENNYKWHNARLSEQQYKQAVQEQGGQV